MSETRTNPTLQLQAQPRPGRRRKALLVLGCHRSGTSAMARTLSLCGGELPRQLQGAGRGNPKGHWEPWDIQGFNDEVLAAAGSNWDGLFGPWRLASLEPDLAPRIAQARRLIGGDFESDLIVLKDPRVSVLLDIWRPALEAEGFEICPIVMVRHPADVAHSLHVRDDLPINHGVLLWLTYLLAVEQKLGDLPRRHVSYTELSRDPEGQLDRIESLLGAGVLPRSWDAFLDVEAFVDVAQDGGGEGVRRTAAEVMPAVADFYEHLARCARDEPPGRQALHLATQWWSAQLHIYGPILERLEPQARYARSRVTGSPTVRPDLTTFAVTA